MQTKVIDNFLNEYELKYLLANTVFNQGFPWFLNHHKEAHFAFSHTFYSNVDSIGESNSEFFKLIKPIMDKLDINVLLRSKANLYYKTNETKHHEEHIDFDYSHKAALLNLNTNNGGTMIDGKPYKSIENQIILFDASKPHSSFTQTDTELRYNIIINYL